MFDIYFCFSVDVVKELCAHRTDISDVKVTFIVHVCIVGVLHTGHSPSRLYD